MDDDFGTTTPVWFWDKGGFDESEISTDVRSWFNSSPDEGSSGSWILNGWAAQGVPRSPEFEKDWKDLAAQDRLDRQTN